MLTLSPKEEVEGCVCEPVLASEVEDILANVIPDMEKILTETDGLGLAAPQVGIKKKFFIIKNLEGEGYKVFFNSFYTKDASITTLMEGCLTYGKGNMAEVKRYKAITLVHELYDLEKKTLIKKFYKTRGTEAIVLQHETDHCGNGVGATGITIFMK